MSSTMLSFVLQYAPKEWEEVAEYTESFILFDLGQHSQEYEEIASLFLSASLKIKSIKRVQQPFQYGRFKLRQEMLRTHTVETVFHAIHPDDVDIAIKHTCDYRRYVHKLEGLHYLQKQPIFYYTVSAAMNTCIRYGTSFTTVLVVCKISGPTTTQSDYFIRYVVEI